MSPQRLCCCNAIQRLSNCALLWGLELWPPCPPATLTIGLAAAAHMLPCCARRGCATGVLSPAFAHRQHIGCSLSTLSSLRRKSGIRFPDGNLGSKKCFPGCMHPFPAAWEAGLRPSRAPSHKGGSAASYYMEAHSEAQQSERKWPARQGGPGGQAAADGRRTAVLRRPAWGRPFP